ncbi:hypothetical protein ACI78T_14850 [Blastococcus sp. SYSU D00922]
MTTARPTALNDDHGDQFPGAVPTPAATAGPAGHDRLVRMHAAYVHKVNAVVGSGNDDLAHELAQSFDEETGAPTRTHADRRTAGRRTPGRGDAGRRPGRVGSLARRSLQRFDRYTLDVFNAGTPSRER